MVPAGGTSPSPPSAGGRDLGVAVPWTGCQLTWVLRGDGCMEPMLRSGVEPPLAMQMEERCKENGIAIIKLPEMERESHPGLGDECR